MKNYLMFSLALLTVILMLYAGLKGIIHDYSYGFFFTFIGSLTAIGLILDIANHLRNLIRKNNVRKLGRG